MFALRAVINISARDCALPLITNTAITFNITGAWRSIANTTVFSQVGNKLKFGWTQTNSFIIFYCTFHIWSANSFTFINTTSFDAMGATGAIFISVRTLTNWKTSRCIWKTSKTLRTFAYITRWCHLTYSRWSTIIASACWLAAKVWDGISTEARGTLANGMLIFCNTNGILSARLFITYVVASVS